MKLWRSAEADVLGLRHPRETSLQLVLTQTGRQARTALLRIRGLQGAHLTPGHLTHVFPWSPWKPLVLASASAMYSPFLVFP